MQSNLHVSTTVITSHFLSCRMIIFVYKGNKFKSVLQLIKRLSRSSKTWQICKILTGRVNMNVTAFLFFPGTLCQPVFQYKSSLCLVLQWIHDQTYCMSGHPLPLLCHPIIRFVVVLLWSWLKGGYQQLWVRKYTRLKKDFSSRANDSISRVLKLLNFKLTDFLLLKNFILGNAAQIPFPKSGCIGGERCVWVVNIFPSSWIVGASCGFIHVMQSS